MTEKWSGGQKLAACFYDESGYGSSAGRRTRAVAYAGSAATSALADWYDARGRVTTHRVAVDGANYDTGYTYDSADRVVTMTYPDGEVVTTTYTAAMQPKTLSGGYGYVTDASYNTQNAPTQIAFGNGAATNYTYDNTGSNPSFRLKGIEVKKNTASLMNLQYGYDGVGNVKNITDTAGNMAFGYDPLDRLTSASGALNEVYAYDQIGNITSKTGVGVYGYGAKPHAATSAGGNTYVYDQNGNMTSRKEGTASYTQNFNIDNKLASVFGNAQVWKFVYDADGNLVKKVDAGGTTLYVGKHYEVLDATKRTGQVFVPSTQKSYGAYWKVEAVAPVVTKYYFFGGQRVAMRVGNGTPMYLHGDHLGSASLTTDNAGGVISQARYAPFGTVRWQSGAMPTNYTFTGQRSESGMGLMDFNARYYDPVLGRFVSADTMVPNPKNPQNLNRYSGFRNNPLKWIDPTGHTIICSLACDDPRGGQTWIKEKLWLYYAPEEVDRYFRSHGKEVGYEDDVIPTYATAKVNEALGEIEKQLGNEIKAEIYASAAKDLYDAADRSSKKIEDWSQEQKQDATASAFGQSAPSLLSGAIGIVHGNSLLSKRATTLYQLVSKDTGEHLKYGITSESPPQRRYGQKYMEDKIMVVLDQGTRSEMAYWERELTSANPGPLNKEKWAQMR